jgi:hypothetical protein
MQQSLIHLTEWVPVHSPSNWNSIHKIFLSLQSTQTNSQAYPVVQWVPEGYFHEGKADRLWSRQYTSI